LRTLSCLKGEPSSVSACQLYASCRTNTDQHRTAGAGQHAEHELVRMHP
jgi:hypothetical protein